MSIVRLSDETEYKCRVLKKIGITVTNYTFNDIRKYIITVKDMPDVDKFIETHFNRINDILLAFSDKLYKQNIIVAA